MTSVLIQKIWSFSKLWSSYRALFLMILMPAIASAQVEQVSVITDDSGSRIQVAGKDFMINGMNWDYFPRGTTYTYSLWTQSDETIKAALDQEMQLLKSMGVNAIRLYTGVQPKWVKYIYETYGIYTMLNHSFGRYGLTINGVWTPVTHYDEPPTQELLLTEVDQLVKEYKDTPGVLMYLLGNENNYGLFWQGAETEDFPDDEEEKKFIGEKRGRPMYKLMNEAAVKMKAIDSSRPVAICNGDVLFIDIIAEECKDIDVFGTNTYRGSSFGDIFQVVKDKLNKPIMFTEFGADAFNAQTLTEDQVSQARYLLSNWQEIYEHSSGNGRVGNSIGGFTFQFSDGWWKFGQEKNLDVHDINASWSNGGYTEDYVVGENNMNEEWFGICAKGPTNEAGLYELYPRAAYYALQKAHKLNPYAEGIGLTEIRTHFIQIGPMAEVLTARGDKAALEVEALQRVRLSGLRIEMETYSTGGDRVNTPNEIVSGSNQRPAFRGFDHLESYYADFEVRPASNVVGTVSLNFLGHVPENPIDEIFYENRGRVQTVQTFSTSDNEEAKLELNGIERLKVYGAQFTWDDSWFKLDGFYRTGHYHWAYEGDFFGLYPDAYYGWNIDIYNGEAPLGMEFTGKKSLDGLKIAFGPELWWGANPAILVKYQRDIAGFEVTGIFQEDIDEQGSSVSSFAVPLPPTRKATLHIAKKYGPIGIDIGGIWSGDNKVGQSFQLSDGSPGNYRVLTDNIKSEDTFGGKVKLTVSKGIFSWYAEGAAMGLVADGGYNAAQTFTGWRLKPSGLGNQWNVLSGVAITLGNWQIAPNFLWQKPVVGPIPSDIIAPGRPRNILSDPFAVRGNRETTGAELLITYDPTPGTWMYVWDSDLREDAPLAASFGVVYRDHPTTQDAAIGIFADGRSLFAFGGAPPARELWEAHARIVSKIRPGLGLIANLYGGTGEANGSDTRLIHRYGGDVRVAAGQFKVAAMAKINDWGPYDYHRDFNQTFPLQLTADLSTVLGKPDWFDMPQTRFGIRASWRSLDKYSPRYCPGKILDSSGDLVCDPDMLDAKDGSEWEIRTYLHLSLGM